MALYNKGAVSASKVRLNGYTIADDATVNFPEWTFQTYETKAMGTMTIPIPAFDDLELTMTKNGGFDLSGAALNLGSNLLSVRWVQETHDKLGVFVPIPCNAELQVMPAGLPAQTVEVGTASDEELKFKIIRCAIFEAGKEKLIVDRKAGILRVNGVDFMLPRNAMLL